MSEDRRLAAVQASGLQPNSVPDHLRRLIELAAQLMGVPTVLVSVVDEDRQYFPAHTGLAEPWAAAGETPLSMSVCRTLVDRGEPLLIEDLAAEADFADHEARTHLGVGAYCGVPLLSPGGEILGSLCAIDAERHSWSAQTLELLEALANTVTNMVQAHVEHRRLVLDLQDRLMPDRLPAPAGGALDVVYRPMPSSSGVGGDFYEVDVDDRGTVLVVVGDIVGHGVDATQAAAQLRAAILAFRAAGLSPAATVERLGVISERMTGCHLAAVTLVEIASDGRDVTWTRAGGMPVVHVTSAGVSIDEAAANAPVGFPSDGQPPGVGRLTLRAGEAVLVFTDGLVERPDRSIDDGFEDLAGAIVRAGNLDELIDLTLGDRPQLDDIAAVRWTAAS